MKVRQRAKQDANQTELVKVIEQHGGSWLDTSRMAGALDGVVGYAGIDQRAEIKDGSKPPSRQRLTDDESDVFETWKGRRPVILKSVQDVLDLLKQMRREATHLSLVEKSQSNS